MNGNPENIESSPLKNASVQRKIFSVSELTKNIKALLEENFPFVWITGEISNFRMPASGHYYFTLKDETSQINSVMFRGQNRNLKFKPEDGMVITGLGRLSVYEPRGTYQMIFELIEPEGIGAIQIAFEQLKIRLAEEGLFDEKFKKPLPFLPQKICILTSPTGAVIHDILRILNRRFPNLVIQIIPIPVQGDGAAVEIESAIRMMNDLPDLDLAILARGGGSLEDLMAFNSENVARAIFDSIIPIISAIGHETDYTIADFVADLRAPTPSAAAEMAVPVKTDIQSQTQKMTQLLYKSFLDYHDRLTRCINDLAQRLVDPKKRIQDLMLRIDDLSDRLIKTTRHSLNRKRERLNWQADRLLSNSPAASVNRAYEKLKVAQNNLLTFLNIIISHKSSTLREISAKLNELNPKAILSRGYSITRTLPDYHILKDAKNVEIQQNIEVTIHKGKVIAKVLTKNTKP